MKLILSGLLVTLISFNLAYSQDKYYTNTGHVSFFSEAPLENITAENEQVAVLLNSLTGEISVAILMRSFEFEKALMQEHFNESYIESDKYPKAKLKGKILNWESIQLSQGLHDVTVKGELSIHGVTKVVEFPGTIDVKSNEYLAKAKFIVKPEDYKIIIPKSKVNNIAKEIEVTVNISLVPYNR